MAKNISLVACSRIPVRLEFFLQFFFVNIVLMFLLYYTCRILCRILCQNVWFCYCSEINITIYILYTKQRICGRWGVPGVGNCLFLRAWGWGIDSQVRKKLQIPGGMPEGGGMVTGRIEPCISPHVLSVFTQHFIEWNAIHANTGMKTFWFLCFNFNLFFGFLCSCWCLHLFLGWSSIHYKRCRGSRGGGTTWK